MLLKGIVEEEEEEEGTAVVVKGIVEAVVRIEEEDIVTVVFIGEEANVVEVVCADGEEGKNCCFKRQSF